MDLLERKQKGIVGGAMRASESRSKRVMTGVGHEFLPALYMHAGSAAAAAHLRRLFVFPSASTSSFVLLAAQYNLILLSRCRRVKETAEQFILLPLMMAVNGRCQTKTSITSATHRGKVFLAP